VIILRVFAGTLTDQDETGRRLSVFRYNSERQWCRNGCSSRSSLCYVNGNPSPVSIY